MNNFQTICGHVFVSIRSFQFLRIFLNECSICRYRYTRYTRYRYCSAIKLLIKAPVNSLSTKLDSDLFAVSFERSTNRSSPFANFIFRRTSSCLSFRRCLSSISFQRASPLIETETRKSSRFWFLSNGNRDGKWSAEKLCVQFHPVHIEQCN